MKQLNVNKPNQLERILNLEKNAETLSMGVRVSQMLLQQFTKKMNQLEERLAFVVSLNNDLQYRLLALQKTTGVDIAALQAEADKMKLEEWEKASEDDNKARNLTKADCVSDENSIVVFTSSTPDLEEDKGIFRSKVSVSEIGTKEAKEVFVGKKPGDTFDIQLAGNKHRVELLEVYSQPTQGVETTA